MRIYKLIAENIKHYPRFIYKRLFTGYQITNLLLKERPYLGYNKTSGCFTVNSENLSWDEKISLRRSLIEILRSILPRATIHIDEIITTYYDQCLERYLFQKVNRSLENSQTCWFKHAQNNKCIGWIDPEKDFGYDEKMRFLDKLSQRKKHFRDRSLVKALIRDKDGCIILRSDNVYTKDDNSLELYRNIEQAGFSNIISSISSIILGYSTKNKRYCVICGRHRIAALRYLRSQGKIRNLKIRCHLVKYPFETLIYTRPFLKTCKQCDWGGIFDPGTGTHQDFYVREGIAVMRGRRSKKGGRQKWNRLLPVFRDMVANKKVLDVGAHRGLYCLKALEYGAASATALEPSEKLTQVISTIKKCYAYEDLHLIKGDFYDEDDFSRLVDEEYDTVFFLGIIHHLLRLGIQKKLLYSFEELLRKIAKIANYGVIIEFVMPKEASLALPEITLYRERFSEDEFKKALKKYFPICKNLGKCRYYSGNRYGRRMYRGLKQ